MASPLVRRRWGVPLSAVAGGAALVVAAFGAVTVSQPVTRTTGHPVSMSARAGAQNLGSVSAEPHDSLYARVPVRVSRGEERPPLVQSGALESAAEAKVEARKAQLESTAAQARAYAEDLASQTWVLPTTGFHISTWFGEAGPYWSSGYHTGIDFATACGTPITAVTSGTVSQAGWDGPYGYQVRERLSNGDEVWYNHMTVIKTAAGAEIGKGSVVGLVGETGNAYGCHVHVEYRLASDLEHGVDPAPFFAAHGIPLR
jgi:murein DD-endopeptidase MepM/ murein hydrolase activator NlpD